MKSIAKLSCGFVAAALLLAGCGGGGSGGGAGGAAPAVPGALDAGGGGLALTQFSDGLGGTVNVNFSNAVYINDFNEVVGFVEVNPGDPFIAGMWTVNVAGATTNVTELPPLAGNTFSAGSAIDDGGNAVGRSSKGALQVAVRWPFGAVVPDELPALAAGDSAAYNVSSDGTLIVGEAENLAGETRAVIWVDAGAGFIVPPIVLPVGAFSTAAGPSMFSSASGVARVGLQVWVVGEVEDGDGVLHAALWRSNDEVIFTATDLGQAGETGSSAYAVNDNGWIVGESEDAVGFTPIRWEDDGFGGFMRVALAAEGTAVAINDNDRSAGWSGALGVATVWDAATPPAAATLFGTASQAYSLNNDLQPLVVGRNGATGFIKRAN